MAGRNVNPLSNSRRARSLLPKDVHLLKGGCFSCFDIFSSACFCVCVCVCVPLLDSSYPPRLLDILASQNGPRKGLWAPIYTEIPDSITQREGTKLPNIHILTRAGSPPNNWVYQLPRKRNSQTRDNSGRTNQGTLPLDCRGCPVYLRYLRPQQLRGMNPDPLVASHRLSLPEHPRRERLRRERQITISNRN